jgi:hypothetical protein
MKKDKDIIGTNINSWKNSDSNFSEFNKINEELTEVENIIKEKLNKIEEARGMISKYNDQQKNVRNNRAFESLSKEIEYQELEIQYCEKQINASKSEIEEKKVKLNQTQS